MRSGIFPRSYSLLMGALGILVLSMSFTIVHAQLPNKDSVNQDALTGNPPLRSLTTFGSYMVELDWEPKTLGTGNDTTFNARFLDKSGGALSDLLTYDFTIAGSDLSLLYESYNQTTDGNGIGKPIVVSLEKPGPIEITVWVNKPDEYSESQSESATFDVMVTPEFPTAPIMATGVIMAVLVIVFTTCQKSRGHLRNL